MMIEEKQTGFNLIWANLQMSVSYDIFLISMHRWHTVNLSDNPAKVKQAVMTNDNLKNKQSIYKK